MAPYPRTILLVEDSEALRLVTARGLKRAGYTVLTAGTVEEAAWMLSYSGVDLVIADVNLPDGSGVDLLQVVSSDRFLLMSGHPPEALRDRGLHLASFAFIPKPFTPEQLLQFVSVLLYEDQATPAPPVFDTTPLPRRAS